MAKLRSIENIIGQTFHYLTVKEDLGTTKYRRYVVAECKCGSIKKYPLTDIKCGRTKSCGCYRNEIVSQLFATHRLRKHPLYNIWKNIKGRCYNENDKSYDRYGGRGITMCDEWKDNPKAFIKWCLANGWKKGLQIDRRENDGIYEPDNCRFVTRIINGRNKRNNIMIEYNGESKCLSEWSGILNIKMQTLHKRIRYSKWSIERAFTKIL